MYPWSLCTIARALRNLPYLRSLTCCAVAARVFAGFDGSHKGCRYTRCRYVFVWQPLWLPSEQQQHVTKIGTQDNTSSFSQARPCITRKFSVLDADKPRIFCISAGQVRKFPANSGSPLLRLEQYRQAKSNEASSQNQR